MCEPSTAGTDAIEERVLLSQTARSERAAHLPLLARLQRSAKRSTSDCRFRPRVVWNEDRKN